MKQLQAALESAAETQPGKRIALWFIDEMRVGETGAALPSLVAAAQTLPA